MSVLLLTPRIYRNMKWSITPKDMFDTVSMSPITNLYETEASELASKEVYEVLIAGTQRDLRTFDGSYDNLVSSTYFRSANVHYVSPDGGPADDRSRVEILMCQGSVTFEFQQPVLGNIGAYITLEGTSREIPRGQDFWSNKPTDAQLIASPESFSLPAWIQEHATAGSTNLKGPYETYGVSSNPFATPTDLIFTGWAGTNRDWQEVQNYNLSGGLFNRFDNTYGRLSITDDVISMQAVTTKLDDYHVRVDFVAPIRFAYLAIACNNTGTIIVVGHFVDSWAYVDRVNKIIVHLSGYALDTSGNDISYSLNKTGIALTEQALNKRIYKVEKNELFTLNTYYGNDPAQKWSSKFALEFLQKYQKGKYLLNLDVPAKWAIENQIHCNSQLKIKLQDNTYIERKGSHCVFEVKTIEKSFKNNEFTFSLGLLEV